MQCKVVCVCYRAAELATLLVSLRSLLLKTQTETQQAGKITVKAEKI